MYAIPALISSDDEFVYHAGSLVRLPDELLTDEMFGFYATLTEEGWHKDHFGYYTFAHRTVGDSLVLFPGICLDEDQPDKSLFSTLALKKTDIEIYVRQLFELEQRLLSEASGDINMLVHDLRSISTSIYNAAWEAKMAVNRGKYNEAQTLIDNVICAQTILKIRTDVLDYLNNPASVIDQATINLKEKTIRVIEAFRPQAVGRSVTIEISSEDSLPFNCPDIFEFIPYVLLENAVKYSPIGGRIYVEIHRREKFYSFSVKSIGPLIEPDEEALIFDRGVRGRHAPTGFGLGIGLYVLRTVVRSHFNGRLKVDQDRSDAATNNSGYFVTTFSVDLPYEIS